MWTLIKEGGHWYLYDKLTRVSYRTTKRRGQRRVKELNGGQ